MLQNTGPYGLHQALNVKVLLFWGFRGIRIDLQILPLLFPAGSEEIAIVATVSFILFGIPRYQN